MNFHLIYHILLLLVFIVLPFALAVWDYNKYRLWVAQLKKEEKWQSARMVVAEEMHRINQYHPWKKKWELGEIFFAFICPLVGLFCWQEFHSMTNVLAYRYYPTFQFFLLIALLSYWLSRKHKQLLPLWVNLLLPYGIALGLLLSALLGIHFISVITGLALWYYPFPAFAFLAPIPAILYGLRQFQQHNNFVEDQLQAKAEKGELSHEDYDTIHTLQWKNPAQNIAVLFLMIASIQVLLLPFGQPMDALVLVFLESESFFFSHEGGILDHLSSFFSYHQK